MASLPRWPLPSGSTNDGPTGSSTTASSANNPNHPSRSLDSVVSIDFFDISYALPIASPPLCRTRDRWTRDLSLGLGDHRVGEPPQAIDLVLQRFDVGPDDIGPAEPDDDVGHALLLQAVHA